MEALRFPAPPAPAHHWNRHPALMIERVPSHSAWASVFTQWDVTWFHCSKVSSSINMWNKVNIWLGSTATSISLIETQVFSSFLKVLMQAWKMPGHPQRPLGDATALRTANATDSVWATLPVEPCHNGKNHMFEHLFSEWYGTSMVSPFSLCAKRISIEAILYMEVSSYRWLCLEAPWLGLWKVCKDTELDWTYQFRIHNQMCCNLILKPLAI